MIEAGAAVAGLAIGCALALGMSMAFLRFLVRTIFRSRYNVTDVSKRGPDGDARARVGVGAGN